MAMLHQKTAKQAAATIYWNALRVVGAGIYRSASTY